MNHTALVPFNKSTQILAKELEKQNKSVIFMDSYKYDNVQVFHPNTLHKTDINEIIIVTSQFYEEIYSQLQEYTFEKSKIYFYDPRSNQIYHSIFYYKCFLFYSDLTSRLIRLRSNHTLKKYSDKHFNQRCFIVGNGPSLQTQDLEKLKNEVTFATNKIYLAFNDTSWRPTYYFVEDRLVFAQNYPIIEKLKGFEIFLPLISLEWGKEVKKALYYNLIYDFKQNHFGTNPTDGLYWGATVTYSMIQMAVYMGFKEIYLLGIDFSFINSQKHFQNDQTDILYSNGEKNHFHHNYRSVGEQWTEPDLDFQQRSFLKALEYCQANHISIYNCSRKTELNVFEKIDFETLFKENT